MTDKIVYQVTGNNHCAERIPYGFFTKENTAKFRTEMFNTMNSECEAQYVPIEWDQIPRGWKSKVVFD